MWGLARVVVSVSRQSQGGFWTSRPRVGSRHHSSHLWPWV